MVEGIRTHASYDEARRHSLEETATTRHFCPPSCASEDQFTVVVSDPM